VPKVIRVNLVSRVSLLLIPWSELVTWLDEKTKSSGGVPFTETFVALCFYQCQNKAGSFRHVLQQSLLRYREQQLLENKS